MLRSRALRPALIVSVVLAFLGFGITPSTAATPITVSTAIGRQDGSIATVEGYVVGQPTATNTVVRSNFPNDYALALADSASQTSTSAMLYVQITSAFRSSYGLQSNPGLLGQKITVTGTLSAYFSHPGLKDTTAFSGTSDPGDPGDYYVGAEGKSGAALKAALHSIISNQTKLTYDQVWNALKDTDQDPANSNNVIEIYSGRSISKSSVSVNAARGNLDFDNGGTAVSQCSGCTADSDSFAPRAAVRGDVARMIFYMAVRYSGDDGFADLEINNSVDNGTAPYIGKLSVLKAWAAADPPDAFEKRRNEVIYSTYQHNRNPFIDHPEWITSIWP